MINPRELKHNNNMLILQDGKETLVDKDIIHKKYNVFGIIRLTLEEYKFAFEVPEWAHWNLFPANHSTNQKFLIAKILRHGSLLNGIEKLPLLDITDEFIVECLECAGPLTPLDIDAKHLTCTYPWVSSKSTLKNALLKKYSKSIPDMSSEKFNRMPFAMTKLKKVDK